jgi:hypothetical protein
MNRCSPCLARWWNADRICSVPPPALCLCFILSLATARLAGQTILIPEGDLLACQEEPPGTASSIAVDADGLIYLADGANNVIRVFLPNGTLAGMLGQYGRAGRVDGSAAQARFNLPFSLCYDGGGGILMLDNNTYLRRLDVSSFTVATLANFSGGIDASNVFDVILGTYRNLGTLNNLILGPLAVQSPGTIFISAANSTGVTQYLLRCSGGVARAIASPCISIISSSQAGTRGLTIDHDGNVFMPFPIAQTNGVRTECIFRFPQGVATNVTQHYIPGGKVVAIAAGRGERLYCFTPMSPSISAFSSVTAQTDLAAFALNFTYPACSLSQTPQSLAVSPGGDLLVANIRSCNSSCYSCTPRGKVDCFSSADIPVGAAAGDLVAPTVLLTSPTNGTALVSNVSLCANASDNSGSVAVQFRVNNRDYGPLLTAPPFTLRLIASNVPAGNLTIYAIARDPAGNSAIASPVRLLNRIGLPNFDGEIFVSDARLDQPIGVALDGTGDVYVGDQTRILRFSPLGELRQIYGTTNSEVADGDAASVRYKALRGLGADSLGRILAMDNSSSGGCYVRRLDPATGATTTLYQLDNQSIELLPANAYNVSAHQLYANGGPGYYWGWLDGRDLAGMPSGDMAVSLGNLLGWTIDEILYPYHFLTRLGSSGNTLLAYTYNSLFPDSNPRAVAAAADGTLFATFQTDPIFKTDSLFAFAPGFPAGGLGDVTELCTALPQINHLAVDDQRRVYLPLPLYGTNPARILAVSGLLTNRPIFCLRQRLLMQPADVAVDSDGNVYVASIEWRTLDAQSRVVANVVRYARAAKAFVQTPPPPNFIPGHSHYQPQSGFGLCFESAPGMSYEIQSTDTLPGSFSARGAIEAAGFSTPWIDSRFGSTNSTASVSQRFYRIRSTGAAGSLAW